MHQDKKKSNLDNNKKTNVLTTPRWTGENHHFSPLQALQPLLEHLEAVPVDPEDLARHPVHLCVMLSALHRLRVLFDGKDLVPAA